MSTLTEQALPVLTVRNPWSEAIIFGGKDVENRTRNVAGDYRGPIAIQTAVYVPTPDEWLKFGSDHSDAMTRMMNTVPWGQDEFGVIIGVVDLVGVHRWPDCQTDTHQACSEWAFTDGVHLELANPRALDQPIPWKGALHLQKTDLFITGDWIGAAREPCKSPCAGVYGCPPSCYSEPVAQLRSTS